MSKWLPSDRDKEIFLRRVQLLDEVPGPRIGDWIKYADGTILRIGHVWTDDAVQPVPGGSFYLGDGYVSFSGSLYRGVPINSLTATSQKRRGRVWFFHDDQSRADNSVHLYAEFRVFRTAYPLPLELRDINQYRQGT
jgi:hypothetical protein